MLSPGAPADIGGDVAVFGLDAGTALWLPFASLWAPPSSCDRRRASASASDCEPVAALGEDVTVAGAAGDERTCAVAM
jgi:hypothetical protein